MLSDISMGPFGSNIKVECFVESGVPVLNGSNLEGFKLKEESFRYVTETKADELRRANAKRGDIVITHRGTLGQIVYIPQNSRFNRYVISQSQFRVRCNEKVIPEYLVYYFHSREGQYKLLSNKSQVGVPALARPSTTFQNIEIDIPLLSEQKAIARVLSALDNKIELNNRINQKLEEMAQAIFKSWFVDFEPFGGEQPRDWAEIPFGEVSTVQNGYAFKSEDYCDVGCKMIRTTNIDNGFINNDNLINLPQSFFTNQKYKDFIFKCFDTVLVMVGASVGKIGLITKKNIPSLQNQNMWRFRPLHDGISPVYVHYYTRLINASVRGWSSGSARDFYRKGIFKVARKKLCKVRSQGIRNQILTSTLSPK